MKTYILLICFVASVMSQRPSFAGGPKGVPDLHPRFKDNETNTNQNSGSGAATELGNRFGETNGSNGNSNGDIPIDARGDVNLVNRLKDWPKENQPFWLVNHKIIEEHRGRPGGSTLGQNVNNQGFTGQQQPTGNTGTDPLLANRFGGNSNQNQPGIGNSDNSFSIVMSGQWRTYMYQPATDSWVRRN